MSYFNHAGRPGHRGGSAPSGLTPLGVSGGITPTKFVGITPGSAAPIVYAGQVHEAGMKDGREHAIIYDATGQKKFDRAGEVSTVKFTDAERAQMRGLSSTHNHPTGSSFYGRDLEFAQTVGLSSTTVVTDSFEYTLTPGDGRATFADVPDNVASIWQKLFDKFFKAHSGPNDVVIWNDESSHALMEQVSKQTGVKYTRRPR